MINRTFPSIYVNIVLIFRLTEKTSNNSSSYTYPTLPIREFHDLNPPIDNAIDDREYAIPDINFYSTFSPTHNLSTPHLIRASTVDPNNMHSYLTLKPISHCCIHQQQFLPMYTPSSMLLAQVEDFPPIEANCGNSLMITMHRTMDDEQITTKEINSDDIIFGENIGHGAFGSVHLGEMQFINNDNKVEKQTVIIKLLNDNVDAKQK